jgi:hypothetical protein
MNRFTAGVLAAFCFPVSGDSELPKNYDLRRYPGRRMVYSCTGSLPGTLTVIHHSKNMDKTSFIFAPDV